MHDTCSMQKHNKYQRESIVYSTVELGQLGISREELKSSSYRNEN